MSGHSRQHTEVVMAVDARRRHQRGEAVKHLRRHQEQAAVSARTGFGALVEPALRIEFAQPVE